MKSRFEDADSTELVMQKLIERLFEEKNLLVEQNRILMENIRDLSEQKHKFHGSHATGAASDKRKFTASQLKTSNAEVCRRNVPVVTSSR